MVLELKVQGLGFPISSIGFTRRVRRSLCNIVSHAARGFSLAFVDGLGFGG